MPPSINWSTKRITIPQSDLTLVSGVLYELDVNTFRLDLKDIEDSEEGIVFSSTHQHNTEVTIAGVTYARTFEIINGYTVEFEDTGSAYTVRCVGANHNISDVFIPGTSEVSLIIGNSAGLIVSGSGVTSGDIAAIADKILGRNLAGGSDGGRTVQDALRAARNKVAISGTTLNVYKEDDATLAWSATITLGSRDPLTSVDPA
jgi:hypothetical protein